MPQLRENVREQGGFLTLQFAYLLSALHVAIGPQVLAEVVEERKKKSVLWMPTQTVENFKSGVWKKLGQ